MLVCGIESETCNSRCPNKLLVRHDARPQLLPASPQDRRIVLPQDIESQLALDEESAVVPALRRQMPAFRDYGLTPEPLAVAKRLGYRSTHQIAITYSQPFKKIRERYEAHKTGQFLSEMRAQLNAVLSQTPPPTLRDTTRKLGVSDGWLRQHFPDERRAIAARYLSYRGEQTALNRASDRDRPKTVVLELYTIATFPSMNRSIGCVHCQRIEAYRGMGNNKASARSTLRKW